MKKFITASLIFLCVALVHGTFITSTTMTNIGSTNSWYISTARGSYQGTLVSFDLNYTKGDETNVTVTFAYAFTSSAPTATDLTYYPETDGTGTVTALTRYMAATKRYTMPLEIPNRATYVIVTFGNTAGTPTGTVVANAYISYTFLGQLKEVLEAVGL